MKPTLTHLLPVLSGIAPAKLRRNYVSNKISYYAWVNKEHPLHCVVLNPQSLSPQRLKLRHPFYRREAEHHNCNYDIIEAWKEECTKHQRPKQLTLTLDTTAHPDPTYLGNCGLPQITLELEWGCLVQKCTNGDSKHQLHLRARLPLKMRNTTCLRAISFVHLTPSRVSRT